MGRLTLITGGARSGKSSFAEQLAAQSGRMVNYLATGQVFDEEMQQRIELHRQRRPSHWRTIEEPLDIIAVIESIDPGILLLDCLALWVSNQFLKADPDDKLQLQRCQDQILQASQKLAKLLTERNDPTIVVTNEVGLGLVPANPLGRYFRDTLGWVNQHCATVADEVLICFSGIPMKLK